jgi:hypothetical protein
MAKTIITNTSCLIILTNIHEVDLLKNLWALLLQLPNWQKDSDRGKWREGWIKGNFIKVDRKCPFQVESIEPSIGIPILICPDLQKVVNFLVNSRVLRPEN